MDLIQNNPFRIAGILSNATERELQRQKTKIKAFTKVGKEISSDFDFYILRSISRTEDSVNDSFAKIQQNQDKVNYALFWFLNASPFDNTAIDYLKEGDDEKALEIWDKVTRGKAISSKNFSAFNNLGSLKLLSFYKSDIQRGIELKIKLIESEYFGNFVHCVADETFTIDNQKQCEKLIDELLTQLKSQYSSSETLQFFENCNLETQNYVSKKFTQGPIHNIESQIESCKKQRKSDKIGAYKFGLLLYKNTKDELSLLKELLGKNDLKYKSIADQLANEIMQCGIDHFNESKDNNSSSDYLESAQKLTKIAASIAVGKLAKDRAKDSLATLEEMKDGEINQAIAVLTSIKLAYEKAVSEIDAQVLQLYARMSYNQTINHGKVNKMKANCLDWPKVIDLLKDAIPPNAVMVIQNSEDYSGVSEYKSLVDFLFSKIGPGHIGQIKYLCYWKDVRAAQAKQTAKQVGRTVQRAAESTGRCYIATMAYGDYDHPQVMELRKFRDDILSKSEIGNSLIKFYYKNSPRLVQRLKGKEKVNLLIRKGLDVFIKAIKTK